MVMLNVKKGEEEALFLDNTVLTTPLDQLTREVAFIYNSRLRVERLCDGNSKRIQGTCSYKFI
jgi:hypothetical protein